MIAVAHVNAESGHSGGEVQMFLLMEGLRALGHRNVLVCPPDSRAAEEGERRDFATVRVPMRNDLDVRGIRAMTQAFREHRVDLAQLHTGRATWLGGIGAWCAGVPAVTTRRMDRRVKRNARTRIVYRRLVDHAVAISPAVADCLVAGGVDPGRISVIWDAVDPDRLRPERSRAAMRAELDVRDDQLLVLATAALVERKGIDVLLRALALLVRRGVPVTARIAGEGESRADLEALTRELELGGHVAFLGWRTDKADLLAAADVAVLPSRREGVGVAALEAMACGVPVVASAVGGLAQVVADGTTGLLVPPDDPEALAVALARFLAEPALGARLASEGPRRVRERFTADQMVADYLALYERLLARRAEGSAA